MMDGNHRGNSPGNISNDGYVASQGDWIYFVSDYDDKLYKMRTDRSERTLLSDDEACYINVEGDWIYYQNDSDDGKLYKIRTDGSERQKLTDIAAWYLNLVNGILFFIDDTSNLYAMRANGGMAQKICDDVYRCLNVVDGKSFYCADDGVYTISEYGTNRKLADGESSYLNVVDDWLYYIGPDGFIYRMRTDGSEREQLNSDKSDCPNVSDGWIYYQNDSDGQKLYKMRIDGTDKQGLDISNIVFINIAGEYIYFNHGTLLWRMHIDSQEGQLAEIMPMPCENFENGDPKFTEMLVDIFDATVKTDALIVDPAMEHEIHRCNRDLADIEAPPLPVEYMLMLGVANGYAWNGFEFYGTYEVKQKDSNYLLWDIVRINEKYAWGEHILILGKFDEEYYVYNTENQKYMAYDRLTQIENDTFDSLADMLGGTVCIYAFDSYEEDEDV